MRMETIDERDGIFYERMPPYWPDPQKLVQVLG